MVGTGIRSVNEAYVSEFLRLEGERKEAWSGAQAWLTPVRKAAIAAFAEHGFPDTKQEEWRFTDVSPIAATAFRPVDKPVRTPSRREIEAYYPAGIEACRLVLVDGHFAPELSAIDALRGAACFGNLGSALVRHAALVGGYLGQYAAVRGQPFTALNTAFFADGAFLYLPREAVLEQPIHLLFVSTGANGPTVTHPRNLIVLGPGSKATVVESYVGIAEGNYFTNTVTELVVGESASIDHYKLGHEAEDAFHIAALHIRQDRGSNVFSHAFAIGGGLVRNDISVVLEGEGAECRLDGLSVLHGRQLVENHLRVEHARSDCRSREHFRSILDDRSRGIFSGRIVVRPGARKTDAKQTSRNLLLSDEARALAKPHLEIFADDVKCTHGVAIGQIDEQALFYLRARGIAETTARTMLIYAFACEALAGIRLPSVRRHLDDMLLARLPRAGLLREAL